MAERERPGDLIETDVAPAEQDALASREALAPHLFHSVEALATIQAEEELPEGLRKQLALMETKLRASFSWEEGRYEELMARVRGSEEPVSEELAEGFRELFAASRLSFLKEPSLEVLDMMTRKGFTVGEIAGVLNEKYPQRPVDERQVSWRLATILTELSTAYDG